MMRTRICLWTLTLAACSTSPNGGAPGYRQLHEQIFSKGCASEACHSGAKGIANLSFDDVEASYQALINAVPANGPAAAAGLVRVAPGELDNSFLWLKLTEHGDALTAKSYGAAMPLSGIEPPGEKSLAAIRAWIDAGAPMDGAGFTADIAEHAHEEHYVECEPAAAADMQKCFAPSPTDGDYLRLYTPPMAIPPRTEVQMCTEIDFDITTPLLVNRAAGQQMKGGHHIAVFTTLAPTGDSTPVNCDDIDMSKMRFVMGAGGAGGLDTALPSDVAVRVLPGQRLMIQSHYINTTDAAVTVMDAVDLARTTVEQSPTLADSFAVIDSNFEIPAKTAGFERVKECRLEKDYDIHLLLGHTHEHGVLFQLDLLRDGVEPELLYYATDGKLLRNNPEIKLYREETLKLRAGDRLRMTCRWDNETDVPIGWPEEMCVTFMYYSPAEGFLTCDSEDETPKSTGDGSNKCRAPGDPGNEVGVGKFCTTEGGECVGNGDATLCLENFDASANYCSIILCETDAQCGAGAHCQIDTQGSACVPDDC